MTGGVIPSYLAMKSYNSCDFVASNLRFHSSIESNFGICDNIAIWDYTFFTPWEIGRGESHLKRSFSIVVSNMILLLKYTHMEPQFRGIYSHVLECVVIVSWNSVPAPVDETAPDSMYNGLYHQCVYGTFTLFGTCTIQWFSVSWWDPREYKASCLERAMTAYA